MVNCKKGNRKDKFPQPRMSLPTLYTLGRRFVRWAGERGASDKQRFVVTADLTNCFPSMRLPEEVWGTFWIRGPHGIYDLRSLPFGWKLAPSAKGWWGGRVRRALCTIAPPRGMTIPCKCHTTIIWMILS